MYIPLNYQKRPHQKNKFRHPRLLVKGNSAIRKAYFHPKRRYNGSKQLKFGFSARQTPFPNGNIKNQGTSKVFNN